MADRKVTNAEWDEVLNRRPGKEKRRYASATCPVCGKTIHEGAWGSRTSNFKKHVKSHDKGEK